MFAALYSCRRASSDALAAVAAGFSPRVEQLGAESVLLDVSGLGRLWPTASALARALVDAAARAGIDDVRIVVTTSRAGAAWIAHYRPGVHVISREELPSALAPLPIDVLSLSPDVSSTLSRWGVRTLGDLATLPTQGLVSRFGAEAGSWQRRARGEDDEPFHPEPRVEPLQIHLDLEWPVEGLEPLSFLLMPVLERLADLLRRRGQRAAALRVELCLADGRRTMRELRMAVPTLDHRTWRTLLWLELENRPPDEALVALTVSATASEARPLQFSLFSASSPSPERLSETLARLADWSRDKRAGAATLLPTHRPGAFAMSGFTGGEPARPVDVAPRGNRIALRAYRPPRPIDVLLRDGRPIALEAASLRGPVIASAGPWRISGDWWDGAWSREEWDVELAGGRFYRLFRDAFQNAWFVEGELD